MQLYNYDGNIYQSKSFFTPGKNFFQFFFDIMHYFAFPFPDAGETIENIPVKRSARRRSIAVKIRPDGTCEILAPASATTEMLKSAIEKFSPWIQQKLAQIEQLPAEFKPHRFELAPDNTFFFCGQACRLEFLPNSSAGIICLREGKLLTPSPEPDKIKMMLEAFYRRQARQLITAAVHTHCRRLNLAVNSININGARRRFGSCSSRGDLNFSWHLAMYPLPLIEYVILHELAHLTEMNHSARFYKLLDSYLNDRPAREKELKLWTAKLSGYPE